MNPIQHLRRFAAVVAGLAAAVVAFGATPAFASLPPGHGASVGHPAPPPPFGTPVIHTVVTGGTPGWVIALIAVGAALLAAILAVLVDRTRTGRRKPVTVAA
jgi:MFS family permease